MKCSYEFLQKSLYFPVKSMYKRNTIGSTALSIGSGACVLSHIGDKSCFSCRAASISLVFRLPSTALVQSSFCFSLFRLPLRDLRIRSRCLVMIGCLVGRRTRTKVTRFWSSYYIFWCLGNFFKTVTKHES